MLYIVGLGLCDEYDITVKGLNAVKSCEKIYLEHYTSILTVETSKLEALYGKKVEVADREMVESGCDLMLEEAKENNVAFLVVGDPFGATTHTDLVIRARELGIKVESIHNASIMNAVGACGLQLYNFGQTISIVFFNDNWRPDSFYDKIKANTNIGLHTLCLLDIKVKEQSYENMARGRKIYEPPRYMSASLAAQQLIEIEEKRNEGVYHPDNTLVIGIARIGSPTQKIVCSTLKQMAEEVDMGEPLHSLIIVGSQVHFLEAQILRSFAHDLASLDHTLSQIYKIVE
ncbi:diphthine synthase-like protein [Neoconidiobolus thromboides FSU 785]|nr:diphthine synthase-like protein [Neoconidiobolus thromboides FSU 785]